MNCRILIVEDEPKLREVLCDYFVSRGERPEGVADGLQALERLEEERFDAVLLDIMMPGLDGLSVCRAVRRNSGVPIIFLTALSDEEDKLLGYELGADDYVTKPFTMSVLYAKTMALIRCSREQLLAQCWGYDYEGEDRAVDTHIKRLREKLGDHAGCIKTVIKSGYRLEG